MTGMLRITYADDYGGEPTIMMDGEAADLTALAEQLRRLEEPSSRPIPIHALPFVVVQGDLQLTAHPVGQDLVLRLQDDAKGGLRFNWQYSEEGWIEAAEKIEPLAVADKRGHQWMNGDHADDAMILISKGEFDEEWWHKRL